MVDEKLACCGTPTDFDTARTKRMSETQDRRKGPTLEDRRKILELQGSRCLYCELPFGSAIVRKDALIFLKLNWDHFVPYAYSQNNYAYNFVAACQICNGIKSSLMFRTLDEARAYIRIMRDVKGVRGAEEQTAAGEAQLA